MQAIEFISTIKEGIIRIPELYTGYDNQQARVIVLIPSIEHMNNQKKNLAAIFKKMETKTVFGKIKDPVAWQKQLRDEWE